MDRASDSGSEGWGFESLPAYHEKGYPIWDNPFGIMEERRDSNDSNHPAGGRVGIDGLTAMHPYHVAEAHG